ncbi:complement receptor type 2-like [Diadema antillarum]|uniref:complement receptor type 2-like n=1 Tax=Diadema antillarum TaxID=105358 RepID=UPI003A89BFD0
MEGNQRSPVFTALQLCIWLCCLSGVLAENCTSLEAITFADITYDPPAVAGHPDTYQEGTVATTQCDDMYAVFPSASAERTCMNGSWSGRLGSCRHIGVLAENCTSLEAITFADITYDPPAVAGHPDTYQEGTVATTQCDDMYAVFPSASAERTCMNGSWSGRLGSCRHIGRRCRRDDFFVGYLGQTCTTACTDRPRGACPPGKSCICDGVCGWSCVDIDADNFCPELDEASLNVVVTYNPPGRPYNAVATVSCAEEYRHLDGSLTRRCLAGHTWSGRETVCAPQKVCGELPQIPQGMPARTNRLYFLPNDTRTYTCRPGYVIRGSVFSVQCTENYTWTEPEFTCSRKS